MLGSSADIEFYGVVRTICVDYIQDKTIDLLPVNLMTLKLAFEVKAVYSLRAALYIVKLLMLLHKLSTAAA
jgi:hypothetical protein